MAKSEISESRTLAWWASVERFPTDESSSSARATTLSWALVSFPIVKALSGPALKTVFPATNDRSPIETSPKISARGLTTLVP